MGVGADLEVLYPNLNDIEIANICYETIMKSKIEFRCPDYGTDRDDNCFAIHSDPVLKGLHLKAVNKRL